MEPTDTAPVGAAVADLDDIVTLDTGEIELYHPLTGDPLGMCITVAGPEHPARKKMEFNRVRTIRKEYKRQGNKMPVSDPEEDSEEAIETLVTCTLSFADKAGQRPVVIAGKPADIKDARSIYSDTKRAWMAKQVLVHLHRAEVFIQSSAKA